MEIFKFFAGYIENLLATQTPLSVYGKPEATQKTRKLHRKPASFTERKKLHIRPALLTNDALILENFMIFGNPHDL